MGACEADLNSGYKCRFALTLLGASIENEKNHIFYCDNNSTSSLFVSTDSQGRSLESRKASQSRGAAAVDGPACARRHTEAEADRHRDGDALSIAPGGGAISRADS